MTAASTAAVSSDHVTGLAEVVITAQRRSESAQRVPIAVAAFNSADLIKNNVTTTADLASVVPGLTIQPTSARSPITLRGVGNNNLSTSPSVITFVDGVYQPFDLSALDFGNVSSIEISKGPQGTLFGRNATGGVIQIKTRDPGQEPTADVELGYANYNTFHGSLYGATGIAKGVTADIAGFFNDQLDGWGKNLATGHDVYQSKRYGVRSKVIAEINDQLTAKISLDYSDRRGSVGAVDAPAVAVGFLYDYASTPPGKYSFTNPFDVNQNFDPKWHASEGGASLTLDDRLGDLKALSITSYRQDDENFLSDFDGGPTRFIDLDRTDHRQAVTQEFQLSSTTSKRLTWVAGLYYYGQISKMDPLDIAGIGATVFFGAPTGGTFDIYSNDSTNAYAGYAQAIALVAPDTHLTLGGRYTVEDRSLTGYTVAGVVVPGSAGTETATFRKPNYRVALDHNFAADILGYISWNRGFNAGFYNQLSVAGYNTTVNPLTQPEGIDAYETGLKTEWLQHRLRINASAFIYDYTNLQTQILTPLGLVTLNAASANIKGVDLDIVARPLADLTLSFSANYLDSHYNSYPGAVQYTILPSGLLIQSSGDAKGHELINAPKWGFQGAASYVLHGPLGGFTSSVNVNYQDKMYGDPFNQYAIPARTLVGASEEWLLPNGRTSFTIWAKNLTNRTYDASYSILSPVGIIGNRAAPRTYGITLRQRFGN